MPFSSLSSTSEEVEKAKESFIESFNKSKENFAESVSDDVIFLAPDEPVLKGKQGETHYTLIRVI